MSANIESMLYVKEIPWHGLGHRYEVAPTTPEEIVQGAELGWEVAAAQMKTDLHDHVFNYNAIYRMDTSSVLGVVNKAQIQLTQNSEMFNAFGSLIGKDISTDTAASIDSGRTVFGCFKISDAFKVLDDDVDHYFVVVNEHLKCDGKITVINTPIRVVCQNTLTAAMSNNVAKVRIPISVDPQINESLARKILISASNSISHLSKRAEHLVGTKISKAYVDKLLEEMFPYIEVKEGDVSTHDRANEKVDMMRETFVHNCLEADNLGNYRGTKWQVMQAVLDFSQHYYTNVDKTYDLGYRMGAILGSSDSSQPIGTTAKFLKLMDKISV